MFGREDVEMLRVQPSSLSSSKKMLALVGLLTLAMALPVAVYGGGKKKTAEPMKPSILATLDYSKIAWPPPPDIARVKYTTYFAGEKIERLKSTQKQNWMDRVAGTPTAVDEVKLRFTLVEPYGMAVDSKGSLYVADTKVGGIFIFNTETKDVHIIKNKVDAHFGRIISLAMDDSDHLYVSDAALHQVLIFNPKHELEGKITDGLVRPSGLAIDSKNRFLYVGDTELDQVLVYDADSLRLLRKIGTTGHKHELTTPGDFAVPSGMTVDKSGNLYVADTLNNRIEVFDPDGGFISTYGKNGDGAGYFARPKGVAVDSDGHIWVSDGMQDRLQIFDSKWKLLTVIGSHGNLPGQFSGLLDIIIDKQNRIFTSEMYPGRVQQLLYIPEAQAKAEQDRRQAVLDKKAGMPIPQSPVDGAPK